METLTREGLLSELERGLETSAEELLESIRAFFFQLGLFGQTLSLEHEGNWYRVSCDEHGFMVYRVNSGSPLRHHVPGWPVCLVNALTIFEEHQSPHLGQDHCACGVDIRKWLEIIEAHSRTGSSGEAR